MSNNNTISKKTPAQPRNRVLNELLFIALIIVGLVYLVALVSHSPSETPFSGDLLLSEPVLNKAGTFGAYLADISLSILGYGAYLVAISCLVLGYRLHKNIGQIPEPKLLRLLRWVSFVVLLLFVTVLLTKTSPEPAGGWTGDMMHSYFGVLFGSSATLIYIGIIMISFSIASAVSWIKFGVSCVAGLGKLTAKLKENHRKRAVKKAAKKKVQILNSIEKKPALKSQTTTKINLSKTPVKTKPPTANLLSAEVSSLPDLSLLNDINPNSDGYSAQTLEDMSRQVEAKLKDFGFEVQITAVTPGPVITQFELSLAPGIKVSQIMNLNKDLARALLVESVRIVDVIPGKPVIGLEIPNAQRETINLKEVLTSKAFSEKDSMLTVGLGKNINGQPVVADLAKMPHLLLAGATGMGKSVGLNAMILSVLFKARPDQVRMIMIDPKVVELACYEDIPHLLTPVVTDMNQAASALFWCVNEMERRYSLLAQFSVRNIAGFNKKLKQAKANGKPLLDPEFNPNTANEGETATELEALPLIMLVIDEYADMLGALAQEDRVKAKRVEMMIVRLAQKARAAGIHLVIATQRPSVDVITGLIKSNMATRIAFKVSSKIDSRTILDQGGAEQLLGMGDMLYMSPNLSRLTRIHGTFVDDDEITNVANFLRENSPTNYFEGVINAESTELYEEANNTTITNIELDPLYDEAMQIVTSSRRASISSLQRRLRIGYNRAARIIEEMESSGVVSTMNNAGTRQVLAPEPVDNEI